jgi:hypothetical protein
MLHYKQQYYLLHCTFVLLYHCRGCSGQLDHWIAFTVVIIELIDFIIWNKQTAPAATEIKP